MAKKKDKNKGDKALVFSTHPENMSALFEGLKLDTDKSEDISKADQQIRVHLEKKGRAGKTVTLIRGILLADEEMKDLLKDLQSKCGVGGTIDGDELLLQGNVRDKVIPHLLKIGYKDVKKSGG